MAERVIEHKWFWAWQDDKEERWLEEMSERGLHLVSPGYFGRYEFEKGQPRNIFTGWILLLKPESRGLLPAIFRCRLGTYWRIWWLAIFQET